MNGVRLFTPSSGSVRIDREEALRYLQVKEADPALRQLLAEVAAAVEDAVCYRACYRLVPVRQQGAAGLQLGELTVESRSLARALKGYDTAALFAATAGTALDRLITRLGVTSPTRALLADALGSAAVEGLCDTLCGTLAGEAPPARFSPGYGDLPLAFGAQLLHSLDAAKAIGVSLTDSQMMTPIKSVTAVLPLTDRKEPPQ